MLESNTRQRFIPYTKADIITMCLKDGFLSKTEQKTFLDVCKILTSILHFQFHSSLETLKNCYSPVNPDRDTKLVFKKTETQKDRLEKKLVIELKKLLDAANFEEVSQAELNQAMEKESLFKIRLHVDFNDFEEVIFFKRGGSIKNETLSSLFGFRKTNLKFTNYDRVAVYVRFKDQAYFDKQKRKQLFFKPGSTTIKLFQNIPHADLEMLFPNTEVKMKTIDKLIIGVPAAIGGVIMLVTKLGATFLLTATLFAFWLGMSDKPVVLDQTTLLALGAGFGTMGAFLWKQFSNFKNRKIKFMKALSDNLYYKNLDNNTGVFHRLIDAAEEEEAKEAILAYYFLLRHGKAMTAKELDFVIEEWFKEKWQHSFDFEIKDAIKKLQNFKLISKKGSKITPIEMKKARVNLDKIWDNYYEFNGLQN